MPPKLQPALLGGTFIGVLSALPFISAGNACCCLWVVGGGVLAAYVMQQNYPLPIATGDGAIVGLLAGIFGAVIGTVLSVPIELMFGDVQREALLNLLSRINDLPPEAQDMFGRYSGRGVVERAVTFAFGLIVFVIAGSIFGTLGGVLGAAMFRKDPPPATPPIEPTPTETPLVP
jgi:hypothetical protein